MTKSAARPLLDRFAEALAETGCVIAACYRLKLAESEGRKLLAAIRRELGAQAI